jgi:hypothetical protein
MAYPQPPTDDELDAWIRAPVTGAPSRSQALESIRDFLRESVLPVTGWQPEPDPALQQQTMPPVIYPAPYTAWTRSGSREP